MRDKIASRIKACSALHAKPITSNDSENFIYKKADSDWHLELETGHEITSGV
jgi:hypothetical protein